MSPGAGRLAIARTVADEARIYPKARIGARALGCWDLNLRQLGSSAILGAYSVGWSQRCEHRKADPSEY